MDLNEKIIECVRKHICLYEPSDRNYKNAVLKGRIWQQIAEQLNASSDTIKRKWKSMRDGYMKYKKQVKGTTGSERKSITFMWAMQLSFLDSGISPRETASNVCESSQNQTPMNSGTTPPFAPRSTSSTSFDYFWSSTPVTSSNVLSTTPVPLTRSPTPVTSSNPVSTTPVPRTRSPTPGASSNPVSTTPVPRSRSPAPGSNLVPTTILNQPLRSTETTRGGKRMAESDVDDMIRRYLNNKKEKPSHVHDGVDYLFLSYAETFKKLSKQKQALLKVDLAKLFSEAELSDIPVFGNSPAHSFVSSIPKNTNSDTTTFYSVNEQLTNMPQNWTNINVFSNIDDTNVSTQSDNAQCTNILSSIPENTNSDTTTFTNMPQDLTNRDAFTSIDDTNVSTESDNAQCTLYVRM